MVTKVSAMDGAPPAQMHWCSLREGVSASYNRDLRPISVWIGLCGSLVIACGSASNDALFHDSPASSCKSGARCGTPSSGGVGGELSMNGGSGNIGGQSQSSGGSGTGGEAATGGAGTGGSTGSGGGPATGGHGGSRGERDAGGDGGAGGSGAVECPDGKYHAVLTGQYRGSAGTRDVGATIDFTVTREGTVTGTFAGPGGAKATVAGSMNCSTNELTSKIEDGSYNLVIVPVRFSGTFDGTYDSSGNSFEGMWAMTESSGASSGGTGPWTTR